MTDTHNAILYILNRIQDDADLYFLCGFGTETFRLLCLAEAEMTGQPVASVEERRKVCFDNRLGSLNKLSAKVDILEGLLSQKQFAAYENKYRKWKGEQ